MVPFEKGGGIEGDHTPDTDLTRCPQVLEEGDMFESSILKMDRYCFLDLMRVDTLVLGFVE